MKFDTTLLALLSVVGIIAITFIVLYFIKNTCPCTLSKQQVATIKKEFTTNKELNMLIHVNNILANILPITNKDSKWLNDFYTQNQFEINNVYSNSISKKDFINEDECAVGKLLQNTFKKAVNFVVNNIDKYEKKLKSEKEHPPSKKHPDHFKGIIVGIAVIAQIMATTGTVPVINTSQFTSILATLPLSYGTKNMLEYFKTTKSRGNPLLTQIMDYDVLSQCGSIFHLKKCLIDNNPLAGVNVSAKQFTLGLNNPGIYVDVKRINAFKTQVDNLPLPQSCSGVDDSSKNSQYKNAAISLRDNLIIHLVTD